MANGWINRPTGSYKTFYTVTSLGLTSGSATVTNCWDAMPALSILIAGVGYFSAAAVPAYAAGQVVIVKATSTNGFIYLHGLSDSVGDYRMFLTGSPAAPSETWVPIDTVVKSAEPSFTGGTYDSSNSSGIQVIGRIAHMSVAVTGVSIDTSATQIGTIPSGYRPNGPLYAVGTANQTAVRIYISKSGAISVSGTSALSNQTLRFSATWII